LSAYRYSISLRIRHPRADPKRFSKQLKQSPQHAWKADEPRTTPAGKPLSGVNGETYWCSHSLARGTWPKQSLPAALRAIARKLAPHKPFFRRIRSERGCVELFVGWYFLGNGGDVIDVELMKMLWSLGIDLSLDVYPPDQPQKNI
jgi:hypothetical protein